MIINRQQTPYGQVIMAEQDALFDQLVTFIKEGVSAKKEPLFSVGLSGGSTPKAFYEWCVEKSAFKDMPLEEIDWSVSDERMVPLGSEESNFGNADRFLLTPLQVDIARKNPWPTDISPEEAAQEFTQIWTERFSANKAFDLCLLGMGDDCHTASLFPHCSLIDENPDSLFAATHWPERGDRLTLTPKGLSACGHIVVLLTGAKKAAALQSVFSGDFNPSEKPIQLLKNCAERVTWLVDPAAGDALFKA